MDWSIGIRLSTNTIEIAAQNNERTVLKRYFKSLTAPEQPLSQFVADYKIEKIKQLNIIGELPLEALEYRLGGSFALLTTMGFDNWLYLSTPLDLNRGTIYARRPGSFIDKNMIFGLAERTLASGQVEKNIAEADLEFLISKLQLHDINTVAVCFLHSDKNPKNENTAAAYLKKNGIQAYTSSSYAGDERARFWATVMNANTRFYLHERLTAIHAIFSPLMIAEKDLCYTGVPITRVLEDHKAPMDTAFSKTNLLAEKFATNTPMAYFGVESFLAFGPKAETAKSWSSKWGPVAIEHKKFEHLSVQPLSILDRGEFGTLSIQNKEMRYDPGPMLFGRGLQPTFIDLIGFKHNLSSINGFPERLSEKGMVRLKENLDTYCKEMALPITGKDHADTLCEALLTKGTQKMALSLYRRFGETPIRATGPLAPMIAPLLQYHCPHIQVEVWPDEFFLTSSLLEPNTVKGRAK